MTTQPLRMANVLEEEDETQAENCCIARRLKWLNVEMPLFVASSMELPDEVDQVDMLYREDLAWLIEDAYREVVKHML